MTSKNKTAVVAIIGPTGTGKTDLSIELAKQFNGEIVALDSRTIYKKMDIGTAKPSVEQQIEVKHHALDLLEPTRFFTVAEYIEIAKEAINTISAQGKLPILCGGTGLYARALLEGIQIPTVKPQTELRAQLDELAKQKGNEELHSRLAEIDPVSAARLNVNDLRRIIRALEVSIISGKPFSQLATQVESPFQTTWIGLNWNDRDLHKKILTERLNKHLQAGLLEEVTKLWPNSNYQAVLSNSINYKEFIPHINGSESLDEACTQCIRNNFQLARKQMIWFRTRPFINWILIDETHSFTNTMDKSTKMLPDYLLHR